jgi:peptidoglycan-associated lipoprotein
MDKDRDRIFSIILLQEELFMRARQIFSKTIMVALVPLTLAACGTNKDLGDSAGVRIGEPVPINQGTVIDTTGSTYGDGSGYGTGYGEGYGTAPVGIVDSSIVPGSQSDMAAQAGSDLIYFETNQHDLTAQARGIVEGQARWLMSYPSLNVTIEGHADERGTREYNIALGDRRANAVRNYMVALGVESYRVNTISYGKEQPLVVGSDGSSWSQNRRARTRVD